MRAISIKSPHIERIIDGRKSIEVRSWSTPYRGDLLIVCSRRPKTANAGLALAVVRLVHIRPFLPADAERAMTDWLPDHWAWELADVRPIAPFSVVGRLGLYDVRMPDERDG